MKMRFDSLEALNRTQQHLISVSICQPTVKQGRRETQSVNWATFNEDAKNKRVFDTNPCQLMMAHKRLSLVSE